MKTREQFRANYTPDGHLHVFVDEVVCVTVADLESPNWREDLIGRLALQRDPRTEELLVLHPEDIEKLNAVLDNPDPVPEE